jgi:hypothetical protein
MLPGLEDETVSVSVVNSVGQEVLPQTEATARGEGRYDTDLPGTSLNVSGQYVATWLGPDPLTVTRRFVVGRSHAAGLTLWELRIAVAKRVGEVILGRVTRATEASLIDDTLLSGSYRGWWLMLDPANAGYDAGRVRRVVGYNASVLELSSPLVSVPAAGDRYALFRNDVSPYDVDAAIHAAVREVATISRISVEISQIPVVTDTDGNREITIPDLVTHVTAVWDGATQLDADAWSMLPGRVIRLTDSAPETVSETLTITGVRTLSVPQFELSTLDIEPGVVIARAAVLLHAERARGGGVDVDEHLRRQLVAQEEFERNIRRVAGRIAQGSRPVID